MIFLSPLFLSLLSPSLSLTYEAQRVRWSVHLCLVVAILPHSSHMTWTVPAAQTRKHSPHSCDECLESRRKESA